MAMARMSPAVDCKHHRSGRRLEARAPTGPSIPLLFASHQKTGKTLAAASKTAYVPESAGVAGLADAPDSKSIICPSPHLAPVVSQGASATPSDYKDRHMLRYDRRNRRDYRAKFLQR
jgi:hypothetical protein